MKCSGGVSSFIRNFPSRVFSTKGRSDFAVCREVFASVYVSTLWLRLQGRPGSLRRKGILAAFFVALAFAATQAHAGGGHGGADPGRVEFRIDRTTVGFEVRRPQAPGGVPSVVVTLKDTATGEAVLDADMLVRLESADMSGAELRGENKTAPDTVPSVPMPDGDGEEEFGLDFGGAVESAPPIDLSGFLPLEPGTMAGTFAVEYPLGARGDYAFTLAVRSLGARTYAEPVIYGGTVRYVDPARARNLRIGVVLSVLGLSLIGFLWILRHRSRLRLSPGESLNLLDIPGIKKAFRSPWFQPVFQVPMLAGFLVIIFLGLYDVQEGDRNPATLLMWTVWWAGIIFTFVFLGRVWCMTCPFGAVQDWVGRRASLNRTFPKPLRNIWLSSFMFLGLTWWDSWSGIVNNPALTSWLLIAFFTIAVGTALIFRGRTLCRYICPIGGLIGLYSMFSPLELRNRCIEVCRADKAKGCIKGTARRYPCPMFVTPMTLDRNNYCNFCSECVKTCAEDNIVLRFRSFAKDLWTSARGYMDEAFLAVVLLGVTIVVTAEMVEPWHRWMDAISRFIPFELFGQAGHADQERITFSLIFAVGSLVVPGALLLAASGVVRGLTGPDSPLSLKRTFVQFAYMFIPVGLSMHLAHNLAHLLNEGPVVVPALQRVLFKYLGIGAMPGSWHVTPLIGPEALFWLQMLVFAVLNLFSLYAGYRIAVRYYGDRALRAFIPMALLAVAIMALNVFVLGQPMDPRHSH